MSIKDDTTSLERAPAGQALVVQRGAAAGSLDADWAALPPVSGGSRGDASAYLHAIRRHWLVGSVLGVILASIVAVGTWYLLPRYYTSSALIHVAMNPESFGTKNFARMTFQEFDIYKATQIQNVLNPSVLGAALRDSGNKIRTLKIYQREINDPITWLEEELVVSFPGNGELMQVSLTDNDPEEVTIMVQAIVDAYRSEIVEREAREKRARVSKLERFLAEREEQSRQTWNELQTQIERHGTSDSKSANILRDVAVQRLGDFRREQIRCIFDLRQARAERAMAEAALKQLDESGALSDFEIEEIILRDPMCVEYTKMLSGYDILEAQTKGVVRPGVEPPAFIESMTGRVAAAREAFEARVSEIREKFTKAKRGELEKEVAGLKVQESILEADEKTLRDQVADQEKEVERLSKLSVELEVTRSTLDNLELAKAKLSEELENLRLDLNAEARITVPENAALRPVTYDNPELMIAITVLMGILGLVAPMIGIVLWDVRKQRINTAEEVSQRLGLPVIGSVPLIPGRTIGRLDSPSKTSREWSVRLTESIDAIAAKLLRNAAIEGAHVVLITSAVSGEGKTTLATQIAMSLARAGRRTVLVDFDLRRPAIDKALNLPLEPGVSEALCGQCEIQDLPHATGTKNLHVVTAGRCDRHALQALANGMDQRLLETLRADFEFVIVDGSPILPVADSRYVAQHVDSVVLSVFRDFSRAPKVMAACEVLETFGVRDVEAVVTSSSEDGYGVIDSVPRE